MKKSILIIITLFTLGAYADTTDTTINIGEVERVVDKYVDKVTTAITGLAESLQVPADHVYAVLVKQQFVNSLTTSLIFIIFFLIPLTYTRKVFRWADKADIDGEHWTIWFIIGPLPSVAGLIYFFVTVSTLMMGFINPEYGAMQEIVNFVK